MAVFSDWGWWGEAASAPRGMKGLSNQYAALPSLHVGWALWSAVQVRANTNSRLLRRWAWTYPALIALVVMATANHYLLDAVAGRLASRRRVDQPKAQLLPFGVGEIPADCAELDDLYRGDLDDADCLPVAI